MPSINLELNIERIYAENPSETVVRLHCAAHWNHRGEKNFLSSVGNRINGITDVSVAPTKNQKSIIILMIDAGRINGTPEQVVGVFKRLLQKDVEKLDDLDWRLYTDHVDHAAQEGQLREGEMKLHVAN